MVYLYRSNFRQDVFFAISATFNINLLEPENGGFYHLPRTLNDAIANNWNLVKRPQGPMPQLKLYCYKSNMKFCIWYDDLGYAAGAQISVSTYLGSNSNLRVTYNDFKESTVIICAKIKATTWSKVKTKFSFSSY